MSQERLEEIKNRRKKHDMDILPVWAEDIDWLIEQTERIQELERKIERYRKVLEFYANKDNYKDMPLFDDDKCRVCGCSWDNACVTDDGPCYWVEEDLCSSCAKGE
mgnify:FL=1